MTDSGLFIPTMESRPFHQTSQLPRAKCVSLRLSFGLLPRSLMLVYCSLQVPCGTQASLYEVCSLPDYTLDNKTHTHSVLLFLEPIPISRLCWPWPLGPENLISHLSKLLFPIYTWMVSFFEKGKNVLM